MHVKVIVSCFSTGLEELVNKWIEDNPNVTVKDIKFSVCKGVRSDAEYSAMILYT